MPIYLHACGKYNYCEQCHLKNECESEGEIPFCLFMNKPEQDEEE